MTSKVKRELTYLIQLTQTKNRSYYQIVSLTLNCRTSCPIIKMYITINNIKGEKRIDMSYSIQNFDSDKEIAVMRMLSNNVKYKILKLHAVMDPISDAKKTIPRGGNLCK